MSNPGPDSGQSDVPTEHSAQDGQETKHSATTTAVVNVVRGGLMGAAEVVPGVSGGTIALIVGVYRTLIAQIAHLVGAVRILLTGSSGIRPIAVAETDAVGETGGLGKGAGRSDTDEQSTGGRVGAAWRQVRTARWDILIPIGIGMAVSLVLGAKLIEPLLEEYPVQTRAVFFGLVLGGVLVPARMIARTKPGPWRVRDVALAAVAAVATFFLTGLPPGNVTDPAPWQVLIAAALAICALVLPGVSGSFILLSLGMYEATIAAVNERNLPYLVTFAIGAAVGLALFVSLLQWLFRHKLRPTLVVITGLMIGSLRALWPWQDADRTLLAPSGDVGVVLLLGLAGIAFVLVLMLIEFKMGLQSDPEAERG